MDAFNNGDYKTAFEKWKPLAELGYGRPQNNLGGMYDKGWGVTQDHKEALKWYRLSADQGHASAQYNLGLMYYMGKGVQDFKEAAKWNRLAADQGHAKAQYRIGLMYYQGKGVIRDNVQAHKWFNIAGENGYKMGGHDRGLIEKFMTPDQITDAQKLAREWMEKHSKK